MKDKHIFPAIFTIESDGISVEFPDLPGCFTCADSQEEALRMAKDALEGHLYVLEELGHKIPEPSPVSKLKVDINQFLALIEVWMPPIRDELANKSVRTNITLPLWLKEAGEKANVNFSRLLQTALKKHLGIDDKR